MSPKTQQPEVTQQPASPAPYPSQQDLEARLAAARGDEPSWQLPPPLPPPPAGNP